MSEEIKSELFKHRRNLILVSVITLLYALAGAEIQGTSALFLNVKFNKPQVIGVALYFLIFYFLWRFWIYAQEQHEQVRTEFDIVWKGLPFYKTNILRFIEDFRARAGIVEWESFIDAANQTRQQAAFDKAQHNDLSIEIKKKFFGRTLIINVSNPSDNVEPNSQEVDLNYLTYQISRLVALCYIVLNRKSFSDLIFPYFVAIAAIGAKIFADCNVI